MKKLLLKSRLQNCPVEIVYMDQRGRISQRTIFVKKVTAEQVIAFCTLRGQQRTFQLENILAVQQFSNLKQYIPKHVEPTPVHRFS